MDMPGALRARIVAALGHARVYWTIVPQAAALPYVRMQVVSDPRPENMGGYDGARVSRVQVDIFADTYDVARNGSETMIAALAAPGTSNGVQFGRIKAEGPRDLGEDTSTGFTHRASTDLLVEHRLA